MFLDFRFSLIVLCGEYEVHTRYNENNKLIIAKPCMDSKCLPYITSSVSSPRFKKMYANMHRKSIYRKIFCAREKNILVYL